MKRQWMFVVLLVLLLVVVVVGLGSGGATAAPESDGVIKRVSVASDGAEANNGSGGSAISADGRYIAFTSGATNLVFGETNGYGGVFVHDRQDGTTSRVSVASSDGDLAISADGRYLAFVSYANDQADVFVHDRQTGQTSLISRHTNGITGNDDSAAPSISADGRFIAFHSRSTNLVGDDANGQFDVFLHDRQTSQTTLISRSTGGAPGNGVSSAPSISADGRFVAFWSGASNLLPGDSNGWWRDVFIYDRLTGKVVSRIAVDLYHVFPSMVALSADGRFAAFSYYADDSEPYNDAWGSEHIVVRDMVAGTQTLLSDKPFPAPVESPNGQVGLSADGRFVVFSSDNRDVDSYGDTDISIYDQITKQTNVITGHGDDRSGWPTISADGRFVAFLSHASNLVPCDMNEASDIFVYDRDGQAPSVYSICGKVTNGDGTPLQGVLVSEAFGNKDITDVDGRYRFDGLIQGNYVVEPELTGYAFTPTVRNVKVPPHASGVNFIGAAQPKGITDLRAERGAAAGTIALSWTVPRGVTPFMGHRIRYSADGPITTEAAWVWATPAGDLSLPLAAGDTQHFTARGLEPGLTYHFAVRVEDEAAHLTPLSNSASAVPLESKSIDLTVSLWRAPSEADRDKYEGIFQHFADAIYEMSNGAHVIGTVTVFQNREHRATAHVRWTDNMWPGAETAGFGEIARQVFMGDRYVKEFEFDHQFLEKSQLRATGYALAHEWGHYYYGLYDEYAGDCKDHCGEIWHPQPDDTPIQNSVMKENPWDAAKKNDYNYNWLNFSVAKNYINRPGEPNKNTAQLRVYGASGWETLARSGDPRDGERATRLRRTVYPELAAVAPPIWADSSLELPTAADRVPVVNVVWVPPSPSVLATTSSMAYAVINILPQTSVIYPEPVMLAASLQMDYLITRAGVVATATLPDGGTLPLTLVDNGMAPDHIAEDGIYSGFLPYSENGDYQVNVSFDNQAGTAMYTQLGVSVSPGPNGETIPPVFEPVGATFSATASATVTVSGMQADDHGDMAIAATELPVDNIDLTGRIDRTDDVDWFAVTPANYGRLAIRVANIGLGIVPRLRVLAADRTTVLADVTTPPVDDLYLFTVINGELDQPVYIEVSDTAFAVGGVYDVSAGTPLPPETATVAGPPQIAGFSVPGAPVGSGVLIKGVDLVNVSTVTFNGVAAAYAMVSDTEVYAEVPAGASSGPVAVTSTHGTATSLMDFLVVAAPSVTGFSPASGLPGTVVTINGTNLNTVTAVAFNGEEAVAFTPISETRITAVVPAMASTGKLIVTTLGGVAQSAGDFTVSSSQQPTVTPLPTLSVTPTATATRILTETPTPTITNIPVIPTATATPSPTATSVPSKHTIFLPSISSLKSNDSIELVGQANGFAMVVAVQGNYAYVSEGKRLTIVNISNPAAPVKAGFFDMPATAYYISVAGNYAYVANADGLRIINISNPAAPDEIGFFGMVGVPYGLAVAGNYAYVTNGNGLRIINVSNPTSPSEVGYLSIRNAGGLTVVGNYAYVTAVVQGLRIVNVANPKAPFLVGTYDMPGFPVDVAVAGIYAYITDQYEGLTIIDVTEPANPVSVGFYNTPGEALRVTVAGGYAYVADWKNGLVIIDIASPQSPLLAVDYNTPGEAGDLAVVGDMIYVADGSGGLLILRHNK